MDCDSAAGTAECAAHAQTHDDDEDAALRKEGELALAAFEKVST